MLVERRRTVSIVSTILISGIWLLAFVTAGAASLEVLLKIRAQQRLQALADSRPRFSRLDQAYDPFGVQHLHPQYLFFFPLDPRERVAISNETCSIDAEGFRGPGPANAGSRRLAFLLGGSAAFGWYASSDATTITSYLNRVQDQYFFVNAGVASWNSTQEMYRLAFQILDYHPALVMTYDGSNDREGMERLEDLYAAGRAYPTGTPEHFDELSALVDGSQVGSGRRSARWLLTYLFPQLADWIGTTRYSRTERLVDPATTNSPRLPESTLQAAAARYLSNLARMHDLTTAGGARFIAVFQPIGQLHRHFRSKPPFDYSEVVDRFHQAVMAKHAHDFEFHDLGSVFDQYYADIPVIGRDVTDETVFVDEVHVYDPGNEVVARHLSKLLK